MRNWSLKCATSCVPWGFTGAAICGFLVGITDPAGPTGNPALSELFYLLLYPAKISLILLFPLFLYSRLQSIAESGRLKSTVTHLLLTCPIYVAATYLARPYYAPLVEENTFRILYEGLPEDKWSWYSNYEMWLDWLATGKLIFIDLSCLLLIVGSLYIMGLATQFSKVIGVFIMIVVGFASIFLPIFTSMLQPDYDIFVWGIASGCIPFMHLPFPMPSDPIAHTLAAITTLMLEKATSSHAFKEKHTSLQ